jgi:hypothetical protein
MFFVDGNNVIICASNLHEKKVEFYLSKYFELAKLDNITSAFSLKKIANVDKVKLIKSQGVKSISMDLSLYEASMEHIERKSISTRLLGRAWDEFKTFFLKDTGDTDIDSLENLTARLVLSYDGRKKDIKIGRSRLEDVAKTMVEEEDEGVIIETVEGQKIKGNDIALKKFVNINKDGKSVWYDQAWDELKIYHSELTTGGYLEQ